MGDNRHGFLTVAVQGCCHGELDAIYETIRQSEIKTGAKVDLLLICGDFQSIRDEYDMIHMAVPVKYRSLGSFHEYVTGKKVAPVLTIFIGGNHEASNYLQSLYYGGFVAPNIYFLGFAGVVWYGGIRVGGISGIFNYHSYRLGHYERPPYSNDSIRSVYHIRELEIYRLMHLQESSKNIDAFLSHEWPQGIWDYGDKRMLLRIKPYFAEDIHSGKLGGMPLMQLLKGLKPSFWFSAHLHVKFAAVFPHHMHPPAESKVIDDKPSESCHVIPSTGSRVTRFLALDKVIPGRDFLQILRIPRQKDGPYVLEYDSEWLEILRRTHSLLHTTRRNVNMPKDIIQPTAKDIEAMTDRIIHIQHGQTIPAISPRQLLSRDINVIHHDSDSQTEKILEILGVDHIWTSRSANKRTLDESSVTTETASYASTIGHSIVKEAASDIRPTVTDDNEIDIDII